MSSTLLSKLPQGQVPDRELTLDASPDVWRPITLEDELSAAPDNTFIDDDEDEDEDQDGVEQTPPSNADPNHAPGPKTAVLIPTPTPTSISTSTSHPVSPLRSPLSSPSALQTWHTTLTTLSSLPASPSTIGALTRHATALHDWIVQAVNPYMTALEQYKDSVVEDNERLSEKMVVLRAEVDELVESYRREVVASRHKTRVWGEGVDMLARSLGGAAGYRYGNGHGDGRGDGDEERDCNGEREGGRDENVHLWRQ